MGEVVDAIYVEELSTTITKDDMYKMLVLDFMEGAIEVDWRDFFPYLKWIPNKSHDEKIQRIAYCRKVLMGALIDEQKKRIVSGMVVNLYCHYEICAKKKTKIVVVLTHFY